MGREPRTEWKKKNNGKRGQSISIIQTEWRSTPASSPTPIYPLAVFTVSWQHAMSAPATEGRYWPGWAAQSLQRSLKIFPFSQSSVNHLWANLLGIQDKLSTCYLMCLVQAKTHCELSWTKSSRSPEPAQNGESSNCILGLAEIQGHWREQMEFQRFFTCKWIFPLRVSRLNNTPCV